LYIVHDLEEIDCTLKMDGELRAVIGGVTLAALLSEMSIGGRDMEGFLFGKITHQRSRVLHDTVESSTIVESEKEKILIGIQGFRFTGVPFPSSFYDSIGSVNQARVSECTKGMENQRVIGWFKFRRNTPLRPSMREIAVHSQLEKIFSSQSSVSNASKLPFLFGIFTLNSLKSSATHTYDYRFLNKTGKNFRGLELDITNLVHSSQVEYSDFSTLSPASALSNSPDLVKYVAKVPSYVTDLEKYFESTLKQLKISADEVHKSTEEIRSLEQEIKRLHEG